MKRVLWIIGLVLFADQVLKLWVKTSFYLGEEIRITDWFILHFTENPGMAFGLELGGVWGKLALSIFRIGAAVFITIWLRNLLRQNAPVLTVTCVSLIWAGAVGNILDSAFYGMVFGESWGRIAEVFPEGGGYAGFLQGHVVDMLYFPLYKGYLPEWMPIWGGEYFTFFRPIFNIADAAISVGIFTLLIFQNKAFPKGTPEEVSASDHPTVQ